MHDQKFPVLKPLIQCRRPHQPSSDIWALLGSQGVADQSHHVHGGSVFGGHLWSWVSEGVPEGLLQQVWRWRQQARRWLQHRRRLRRWDYRNLCSGVHCVLCYWSQEERQRFPCASTYYFTIQPFLMLMLSSIMLLWVFYWVSKTYIFYCSVFVYCLV